MSDFILLMQVFLQWTVEILKWSLITAGVCIVFISILVTLLALGKSGVTYKNLKGKQVL